MYTIQYHCPHYPFGMADYITGDVLKLELTPTEYICHQCNCSSHYAKYLAYAIFKQWPYANIYNDHSEREPGNIIVRAPVINLLGQRYASIAHYPDDTIQHRVSFFQAGLDAIREWATTTQVTRIYFPYKIGCSAAGGDWLVYRQMIDTFAESVADTLSVVVVRLP